MVQKTGFMLIGAVLAALALGAPAAAQKQILALVVKGLDNPFFTVLGDGCAFWNEENPEADYDCAYTGPMSGADETGQVRIVEELIDAGVAGIAISPANAPAMAAMLREKQPSIPVITIDADLDEADRELRRIYLGTDSYEMGVVMAEYLKWLKPGGGTLCLQLGNESAENLNARARGLRDDLAGEAGIQRLDGEGGWTEIEGCPLYSHDQSDLANQQLAEILSANPELDALVLVGGWAQFDPQAYARVTDPVMDRLAAQELIIIAGDALPRQIEALRAGRSHIQIGQHPFEMGYRAPEVLIELIRGRPVDDPLHTGLDECSAETMDFCVTE